MSVELIISQGSRAGTPATIRPGYYLVGRHKECQIRPKSKSVSRRHCLLLRNEDGFGALDLKSTGGTYVNGVRLHPHQWRVLADGDEIRFGKVLFHVAIENQAFAGAAVDSGDDASDVSSLSGQEGTDTSDAPESWQNVDVAEFLELEDQLEFDRTYGAPSGLSDSSLAIDEELGERHSDSDVLSDSAIGSGKPNDTFIGDVNDDFDEDDAHKDIELDSVPKPRPPRKKIDHKQYKRAPKRSLSLPSFGFSTGDGVDWKLLGTVALVMLTVSLLAYQVYQFSGGTQVEIRRGLD